MCVMKGLVNSDDLLRHILNKTYGLRPAGAVITHASAVSLPGFDRLVVLSDVAVIPYPTLEQRAAQLDYTVALSRTLGTACPRVALLHCTEKVSEAFPVTLDYVELCRRAAAGEWAKCSSTGRSISSARSRPRAWLTKGWKVRSKGAPTCYSSPTSKPAMCFTKPSACSFPVRASLLCSAAPRIPSYSPRAAIPST